MISALRPGHTALPCWCERVIYCFLPIAGVGHSMVHAARRVHGAALSCRLQPKLLVEALTAMCSDRQRPLLPFLATWQSTLPEPRPVCHHPYDGQIITD